ncbi:hypothetical protein ACQPZF_11870 [Actinosynnema sp. CS-041913]|uniref:hypothetical protein n=1 Tax=Actinosynnema sp. CS-041913 TaxID=3239917 RepID=UPI003D8B6BDE
MPTPHPNRTSTTNRAHNGPNNLVIQVGAVHGRITVHPVPTPPTCAQLAEQLELLAELWGKADTSDRSTLDNVNTAFTTLFTMIGSLEREPDSARTIPSPLLDLRTTTTQLLHAFTAWRQRR